MENFMDDETINGLKTQRTAELLQQVLIDTALAVVYRVAENQKLRPQAICYKPDCPMRDSIPF